MCEKYCGDRGFLWRSVGLPGVVGGETMSGEDKQRFSMEMVSVGTEVGDDGKVEPIYSVQFTTPNGTFRYPWKHLKETVGNWVEIEEENR